MKNSKFAITLIAGVVATALCAPAAFAKGPIANAVHDIKYGTDTAPDTGSSSVPHSNLKKQKELH
jgi:hypothetical protein